jgi:hypothetical protein
MSSRLPPHPRRRASCQTPGSCGGRPQNERSHRFGEAFVLVAVGHRAPPPPLRRCGRSSKNVETAVAPHSAAEEAGRLGGLKTSPKKARTARINGKKGGRPPNCKTCQHKLSDHQFHTSRNRGHCLTCDCTKYIPDVPYSKPLNSIIGRIRYKKIKDNGKGKLYNLSTGRPIPPSMWLRAIERSTVQ